MGTMKVVASVMDTIKRPHMGLMLFTVIVFQTMTMVPDLKHALAWIGALGCVAAFVFVGKQTTKAVQYLERVNTLFLLLIFCGVATA